MLQDKTIGEGGPSTWELSDQSGDEDSDEEDSDDVEMVGVEERKKKVLDEIGTILLLNKLHEIMITDLFNDNLSSIAELSGDSEEETTGTISTKDLM